MPGSLRFRPVDEDDDEAGRHNCHQKRATLAECRVGVEWSGIRADDVLHRRIHLPVLAARGESPGQQQGLVLGFLERMNERPHPLRQVRCGLAGS